MPYQDKLGRMCGFLNMSEKDSGAKFVRRYFILDPRSEKLTFYKDNPINLPTDQQKTAGEISIAVISKVSEVSKKQKPKIDSCFVINHAGQTLYLQGENQEDMEGWIHALNNISKITVPEEEKKQNEPEAGYTTQIAGGVVCKIPIKNENENESAPSSGAENSEEESTPCASSLSAIKSGFCVKQGGMRKNWKRRYFVVNENGLYYFPSEQSREPLRYIPQTEIVSVREGRMSLGGRDNLFEVATNKRTFYIQCDTPEDMQDWINAVNKIISKPPQPQHAFQRKSGNQETIKEDDLQVSKVFPQNKWENSSVQLQTSVKRQESRKLGQPLTWKPRGGSVNTHGPARAPETGEMSRSMLSRMPEAGSLHSNISDKKTEDRPIQKSSTTKRTEVRPKNPLKKQRSWFLW